MKEKIIQLVYIVILFFYLSPCYSYAQIITTVAGSGAFGYSGDSMAATATAMTQPVYIALDNNGNLYVCDQGNNRIRMVNTSGIINTIAGTGVWGYSGDGTPATSAEIKHPYGIAVDASGSVYISDNNNFRIRRVDPSGMINTIAGTGAMGFSGDGSAATLATFQYAAGICLDGAGNLLLADDGNAVIRKITPAISGIINTVAGIHIAGPLGDDGPATTASLSQPSDIALDGSGNLYIADVNNNRIRRVDTKGIISTFAGNGGSGYSGDGVAATATELNQPEGIAIDGCGNVYIADRNNNRVRKVDVTGIITTIAGNGTTAFGGDGGAATAGILYYPNDVKSDKNGNIFVADAGNYRVRKIGTANRAPSFISGHTQSIVLCSDSVATVNAMLSVIDSDTNQGETWSVWSAPAHGTLTGSYLTISTGGTLTPGGLSYTPGGYVGADSFKIVVTDCDDMSDTTTVYVTAKACPLSVSTATNNSFEIFPNPATNSLTIVANETIRKVVISNIAGQAVYSHTYNSGQVHVGVAALPKGIYFVKINGSEVRKFVKE